MSGRRLGGGEVLVKRSKMVDVPLAPAVFRFARLERIARIRSFSQSHAEVVLPLVFSDFINRHYVRMRETRRRFRFSFEAFHQLATSQRAGTGEFECDESIDRRLPRLVDSSYPLVGNLLDKSVIAKEVNRDGDWLLASLAGRTAFLRQRPKAQRHEASPAMPKRRVQWNVRPAIPAFSDLRQVTPIA